MKKLINDTNLKRLEKIRNSHNWCCLEIHSDYNYIWTVSVIRQNEHNINNDKTFVVFDEDLNKAIQRLYKEINNDKRK